MILLSDCVAQIESSNNSGALRYEPGYQPSALGIGQAAKFATGSWIDKLTAETIVKCSYGRFQIMGDNLYNAMQYSKTIWHFVATPQDQLDIFNEFLTRGHFKNVTFESMVRSEVVAFALYYNGSAVYADSLAKAYNAIKG